MNKGKLARRIGALLMVGMIAVTMCPLEVFEAAPDRNHNNNNRITHGTSSTVITEDMLTTEIPDDYQVNEATQGKAENGEYNAYFLEEDIQTVEIMIDENNLNYLLQNATDEPYVMTTSVTIGDVTLGYCGLKTKGNYTLEHSYTENAGSDRFSFTVNFGKYVKKAEYGKTQDFFGCNKISFNNFFFDKTMMKEFFALKLMDEMGLPTPQYGLAKLYINGEYYGVYAMIEAFDESILEQYYGVDDDLSSYLVKPVGTNFLESSLAENMAPLWENDESTKEDIQDMLPTVIDWVKKLNCLHEGTDFDGKKIDVNSDEYIELLNQIYDVDEALRYFATHSWLCQMDNMFDGNQNFGLYVDQQGKAMLIPWDYDLSFGCFYPSTAEATANFDLDVMWRNGLWGPTTSAKQFYKDFPLFNVIYQNDALMEKYYAYMKECSQIAALGGTLASTGKTYEPGYFNSYIEAMQEELIEAASEPLADNVYYMNNIKQPSGVKNGLSNLSKIIAMRAVGVYVQVENIDTTVSGAGCNLETLGNAMQADASKRGNITIVDNKTGIFASATYANDNRQSPQLALKQLGENETYYTTIQEALRCSADKLDVYYLDNKATPEGSYTLTIPMSQTGLNAGKIYQIYACSAEGETKLLEVSATGNLYTVQVEELGYIAVVEDGGFLSVIGGNNFPWGVVAGIAVLVIAIAGVGIVIVRKKKK